MNIGEQMKRAEIERENVKLKVFVIGEGVLLFFAIAAAISGWLS